MNATDIFRKLRIDKAINVLIVNAPTEYNTILKGIKFDTKPLKAKKGTYDFVQVFATSQSELEKYTLDVAEAGSYDCIFWACYPKGSGSIKSDIKRDNVWKAFDLIGLQAVSQIAIDETWSALRARPVEMVGK